MSSTNSDTNWVNIGLGALVVGLAFALMIIVATGFGPQGHRGSSRKPTLAAPGR